MTASTRVFIVDDHPVVRAGLKELVRSAREISIIGEAGDGEEATLATIERLQPDVVILDIRLRRGDGIDLCRNVKARVPRAGVILLSAFWDESLVRQALDARADGYLLKDAEHLDLKKSILSVARGESFFDTAISAAIAREARGEPQTSGARFSEQDVRILRCVSEGHTNKTIGEQMFLSPHTVRDRLSDIMAKLGARNRAQAAQMAMRSGLLRRLPPEEAASVSSRSRGTGS